MAAATMGTDKCKNEVYFCKTSLTLNSFDRLALAQISNKGKRFHVAIIQGYYAVRAKLPAEYTMLHIDPIYTIEETGNGKLCKRRILERYDTHYLYIPASAANCIRRKWQDRQRKMNPVISFTERSLDLRTYKSEERQISVLVLFPEGLLCISSNLREVLYYRSVNEQVPRHRVPDLNVRNLASYDKSVTVRDIDQSDIADLKTRSTGRSTEHADSVNGCNFDRKNHKNITSKNVENSSQTVMIYNEITNLKLRPVMLDGSRIEFSSRGPYDYEFQASYMASLAKRDS